MGDVGEGVGQEADKRNQQRELRSGAFPLFRDDMDGEVQGILWKAAKFAKGQSNESMKLRVFERRNKGVPCRRS